MGRDYSLKLIFSNKRGEYLSDVIVKILDWNEKTILTTVSNGPWLFIDLPTGVYDLEASLKGDRKKLFDIPVAWTTFQYARDWLSVHYATAEPIEGFKAF